MDSARELAGLLAAQRHLSEAQRAVRVTRALLSQWLAVGELVEGRRLFQALVMLRDVRAGYRGECVGGDGVLGDAKGGEQVRGVNGVGGTREGGRGGGGACEAACGVGVRAGRRNWGSGPLRAVAVLS